MPPNRFSRHRFAAASLDPEDGMLALSEPESYGYRDFPDNRRHLVALGDTWWTIAGSYFAGLPRPAGFWWAICHFQPVPVVDPTIALEPGTVVVVPSIRTLQERILNDRRVGEDVPP
jgi:hypothetical protein